MDDPQYPDGTTNDQEHRASGTETISAASTPVLDAEREHVLAEIWKVLLNIDDLDPDDDFYMLGGDSLLMAQMLGSLRKQGWTARLQDISAAPVFRELAQKLIPFTAGATPGNRLSVPTDHITTAMLPLADISQSEVDDIVERVPGGAANVQDIYSLLPMQAAFLYHNRRAPKQDPYVVIDHFKCSDRDAVGRLIVAFQGAIDRHDILRTIFFSDTSEPVQVVLRTAKLRVVEPSIPLSLPEIRARLCDDPMWLDVAPLLRCYVVPDDGTWNLFVMKHHIIGDHVSFELLHNEVAAAMGVEVGQNATNSVPFREAIADYRKVSDTVSPEGLFPGLDNSEPPYGLEPAGTYDGPHNLSQDQITEALYGRLRGCARGLGVSLASLCHLAWGLLLARASGHGNIVTGSVFLGRTKLGQSAEPIMGPMINTLPIGISIDGRGTAKGARDLHTTLTRMLEFEQLPYDTVQRLSGQAADVPLFSALLNFRHSKVPHNTRAAGYWHVVEDEHATFPLTCSIDDYGDGMSLTVQVPDKLDAARIRRGLETALLVLADTLEHHPERPLSDLDVLAIEERVEVLETWNQTETDFPSDQRIHEVFQHRVLKTPDAPAIIESGKTLTYAELKARSDQIARWLGCEGVGEGDHIVLLLERGSALIAAELAISKLGGVYVPLDPTMPADRITMIVADCRAVMVLVDGAVLETSWRSSTNVPVLQLSASLYCQGKPAALKTVSASGSAPAYVMYTSGSTGVPKGVCTAHRSVIRLAVANKSLPVSPVNRFAFASNPSFDASTFEIWGPLLNGASLVVIDRATLLSAPRLSETIVEKGIDTLWLTAGIFNQMAADLFEVFPKLATLVIGGDVADREAVHRVAKEFAPGRFLNGYGPTEVTTFSALFEIHADLNPDANVPIGPPMSNTRAYVLDTYRRPVPVGAVGELFLGGPGVALGYLNQPELTKARFHPDPFAKNGETLMYQTGDLVCWLPDGALDYHGRKDQQVKIRGYRVELEEVRVALLKHSKLADAVVVALGETAVERRLAAYVVPEQISGEAIDLGAVRDHVKTFVPGYMVPQTVTVLEKLPLTSTGKVDRRALPEPDRATVSLAQYESPCDPTEDALAEILCDLLSIDRIGRQDDLFDLGLHSLLILKFLTRIRAEMGTDITPEHVFANPTVGQIAAIIKSAKETTVETQIEPIPTVSRNGALWPSHSQERLWFLSHFDGADKAYTIPTGVLVSGPLDQASLQRALQALFARHEVLRSQFIERKGRPSVSFLPSDTKIPLTFRDLRGQCGDDRVVEEVISAEWDRPFNLSKGPLIRAVLVRLTDTSHLFVLTQHHIISDGWSLEVLGEELSRLYKIELGLSNAPLSQIHLTFQDYSAWQRDLLKTDLAATQITYWCDTLRGAPMAPFLPTDRPRPTDQDFSAGSIPIHIPAGLTRKLEDIARQTGTTLFVVLLAAWSLVLSRCANQRDVIVGIPAANRAHPDLTNLLGFFANTLAIRIERAAEDSLSTLLRNVHRMVNDGQRNQDVPWEQVVDALQPVRRLDHTPVCQVMFSWQVGGGFPLDFPGASISPVFPQAKQVKFEQHLDLTMTDDGIRGHLNFATALFDVGTAELHVSYLSTLLAGLAAAGTEPVETLDMLPASVRARLISDAQHTKNPISEMDTLGTLLDRQAATTPDATALRFGDRSMSYRDLDTQANRLAVQLRNAATGQNPTIGISIARSPKMIVALVAIAKAGLAFVPMEPDLPKERLRCMQKVAAPEFTICDADGESALAQFPSKTFQLNPETGTLVGLPQHGVSSGPNSRTQDDLAYILFTSGSTGEPKGVMIDQRSLVNHLTWIQQRYRLTSVDVVIQKTPLSFDVSVWEVFWPLISGATLAILPQGEHKNPRALAASIEHHKVTVAHFVPSMMTAFLSSLGGLSCASMRQVFLGGEHVKAELVQSIQRTLPRVAISNFYGPSECTIEATSWDCPKLFDGHEVPIGMPISNMAAYVLDPQGRFVPHGTTGELFLSGAGVARGYAARPDLTAERFGPDPFVLGRRMYQTGDLVRRRADGQLVFVGRADTQIKLRGYRIEISEIERVLLSHPAITEAAVLARDDPGTAKRLVGYVVMGLGHGLKPTDLRRFVLGHVPDYMAPSAYVCLNSLPLSVSGKLDRQGLPAPQPTDYCFTEFDPPKTETERALAMIWGGLLDLDRIGRDDNFFDLGGNSLLSIQAVHQATQQGLPFGVADLVACPVLSLLAYQIDERVQVQECSRPAIHTVFDPVVPLTHTGARNGTVFVFPGAGMGSTAFRPFATFTQGQFSVLGLEPPGLIPEQAPCASVDEAAVLYANSIASYSKDGPVHLIGHSFGALVAFETAQRLSKMGAIPTSVSFFDPPGPVWPSQDALHVVRRDFATTLSDALSCNLTSSVRNAATKDTEQFISALRAGLIKAGALSRRAEVEGLAAQFETYRAARQTPYRPQSFYGGAVQFILADVEDTAARARIAGWAKWVQDMSVSLVPGGHHSMLMTPHVGAVFRQWLAARGSHDPAIGPNGRIDRKVLTNEHD